MTPEEYKKLNNYLNLIFLELDKYDYFLLDNIKPISSLNEMFNSFIWNYDLSEQKNDKYLSYEELYKITREIIASIDEKYLSIYDKVFDDGTLDFNYENSDSCCYVENNKILIDVDRKFNFNDVIILIHEFMHYTNRDAKKESINRYLLTEFISIYFEIYAQNYLIKNYNISKESIGIYFRLNDCKKCCKSIYYYCIPFFSYLNQGNLNDKSSDFTNKFFIKESKENFEKECHLLLDKCINAEQQYNQEILYEKEFKEEEFGKYLIQKLGFKTDYRYLLGTVLAYYAIENIDIRNIVALNDIVNSNESSEMTLNALLYKFGIDLSDNFEEKAINYIKSLLSDREKIR